MRESYSMWSFEIFFLTQYNAFAIYSSCCLYKQLPLFLSSIPWYRHDIVFTCLPVERHFDCFQVFFFFYPKYSSCKHSYTGFFIYLGKMPSSVILESYDKCSIMFQRDCQTIFDSGLSILHSYQQCMRDSILLYLCQNFM